jgi:hypothetical protein
MSAGITRIHGSAVPQTLTGGYQLAFYTVSDNTINYATGYTLSNSAFELAVRGIENLATVVVLGTPTSAGFTVAVDQGSFIGRGDSTGYATNTTNGTTAIANLAAAIKDVTGSAGTVTVASVALTGTGLA